MTTDEDKLLLLRQEIDAIDNSIHDLIMKRTRVVERVRKAKHNDKIKIRPAREAEILYRLLVRHEGPFPKQELARIWREMIVATLRFEGPFSVAVSVGDDEADYWDLARDQYGSFTPMTRHVSPRGV
ncbi:MAG: chorismate mutase, partial [Rhodospirillales bacterium]|nr:chorismate mutase [Rhodospirillales bacterium]